MEKLIQQICPVRSMIPIADLKISRNSDFNTGIFDERVVSFFNELSISILRNNQLNRIPATAALGFWLRKSHINQIISQNQHLLKGKNIHVSPSGTVFHICPSNVDTMFLYSLAISLLAGNKNILRISQRVSDPLLDIIFNLINEVVSRKEFEFLQEYLSIVTYGHDDEINNYFSQLADVRILWGGDSTINTFKKFTSGPRTRDIAFADRISCAVFNAGTFLSADQKTKVETARKFFNDSYTFDQLGCSSPQHIFILGSEFEKEAFETEFYSTLERFAKENYNNDITSIASLKLNKLAEDSINIPSVTGAIKDNNYLYFINLESNHPELIHSCGAGFFYVQHLDQLSDLKNLITKKLQTIVYYGLTQDDIAVITEISKGKGIDRIVPVGSALDFEYIWDGYNLLDELTVKKWVI
jgi:hypothetical protein